MKLIRSSHQPHLPPSGQAGFSLAALLAALAVLMIVIAGAAPNLRQQAQREKEAEAIFRGEQVAQAIRLYARFNNGVLPTKMEQLIEGVPRGTKRVQVIRASAARDPLSKNGEWQLIAPNDSALVEFQQALIVYAGMQPRTTEPSIARHAAQITSVLNLGSQQGSSLATSSSPITGGPFIGVASQSKSKSVLQYYGIEEHRRWIFTPLFR